MADTFDAMMGELEAWDQPKPAPLSVWQKLQQTWPARMAVNMFEAAKLPGDVYAGRTKAGTDDYYNRATDLAGLVMGGSYAAPAVKGGAGMGIRAYHGSPHDFDRFDMSKIGTGEGAQAYGHGLYFAEAEATAKSYRDALAGKGLPLRDTIASHLPDANLTQSDLGRIYSAALNAEKDPMKAAQSVQMMLPHLRDEGASYLGAPGPIGQKIAGAISDLREKGRGRMYEVNINAKPEQFLDWDKPIMQHDPNVLNALNSVGYPVEQKLGHLGSDALEVGTKRAVIGRAGPGSEAELVAKYANAGIPGIKYLDQGSRGAGQGSSNYVVFDDKIIDILKKYGLAGLGLTGLAAAASDKSEAKTPDFEKELNAILQ